MVCKLCRLTAILLVTTMTSGQRVAPGVPPQHYQQVPVQQQYQQQSNQQHMQVAPGVSPQQYQQQGQVQYQQQQFQHGVPVQNVHPVNQAMPQHQVHPKTQGQQHVLSAGNLDHERAHIQEHMQVPIDTSKMTDAELQFHYFKIHDSDNNNKLDGCELIKSLIHWHEQGSKEHRNEETPNVEAKIFSDEDLVALIDPILQMDDISRDGYIDYPEFIKAQQKATESNSQQKQQQQPQQ